MSDNKSAARKLITHYWRVNGLELPEDLVNHQEFLLTFAPTGHIDQDIAAFLNGVGQPEILRFYRQLNLPLQGLATQIRNRHREELARISRGQDPEHDALYYRRSPKALQLYSQLLELENEILTAILDQSKAA